MILADKIIELRKKNGWSQEEFAEKLQVSRQSVSRWEGAQSVPDLQKILQMAQLFGVSTDYLLKDEMVEEERVETEPAGEIRRVTMEEAQEYLALREKSAVRLAWSVFLCIASPAALIALGAFAGAGEETVGFFGIVLMLVMMVCWCFIRVSYILLIARASGNIQMVFWAYPITWSLSTICLFVYYLRADWPHYLEKRSVSA